MRITVDSLQAGIHYPLSIGNCNVFIDGVECSDVTELDQKEGWLIRFVRDDKGCLLIEGDQVKEETLYGEIVVMDNLQKEQEKRRCQKP